MKPMKNLLERYAELEMNIRELMTHLFSESCGLCTACCCRADICEEATESAFLAKLLQRQGLNAAEMDDSYGWLDLNGCSLQYGRPPVCYEFFCGDLLHRMPDDETRLAATALGKLMNHIGRGALGEWHLVEIMEESDLEKIDFDGILKRLDESTAAFAVIREFLANGRLTKADREALEKIEGDED